LPAADTAFAAAAAVHCCHQNDDLFLNTTVYNTPNIFRMTAADYTAHATWQTTINANLPPGSSFK
jgi:hypothetical protein